MLAHEGGNLVQNASFEEDWIRAELGHRKRFLLLHASDLGMAEADGRPDYWTLPRDASQGLWETKLGHTGQRSLCLAGKAEVFQRLRFAAETSELSGGAHYAASLPMQKDLAEQLPRRAIVVGAWCRTQDLPAGAEPELKLEVDCQVRSGSEVIKQGIWSGSVAFEAGTHDWQYREIRVVELPGTPFFVKLSLQSKEGTVWFDDVSCSEPLAAGTVNLLPAGDFEQAAGWDTPAPWNWLRTDYYAWAGWSHPANQKPRGGAWRDALVRWSGGHSLRLAALPGDSFCVAGPPVVLDQKQAGPLEVRAMVLGDNLRGFEIMAQDETGRWLPQADFVGDDLETEASLYDMGSTALGTHPWLQVRKYFSPRRPVRQVRLYLCMRGFDGLKTGQNLVSTAWVDQLQLLAVGPPAEPPSKGEQLAYRATAVELGDRLWGQNVLRYKIEGRPPTIRLKLRGPDQSLQTVEGKLRDGWLEFPYRLDRLCPSWKEQYSAEVWAGDELLQQLWLGTPSQRLEVGIRHYFPYSDEPQTVWARLNVARGSLSELGGLQLLVNDRVAARSDRLLELYQPRLTPSETDTARLLVASPPAKGATIHPWSEPARDQEVRARLLDLKGQTLETTGPVRFGYLTTFPRSDLPDAIESTRVNARGYLRVNEEPFFPVYFSPHIGTLKEVNYPPKGLNLTDVALKGEPLEPLIQSVRTDPGFFQYELGEGEMNLQGPGWLLRLGKLKQAIATIKSLDPDHVVNGPSSWLVGHPRHQQDMQAFLPYWDAIGVETSFEEFPRVTQDPRHPCAVLAGLEAYFYQPLEVLRWRAYQSVIHGCAGVGLCPSGMLQARPDMVSFLRGLNGEFRGLGPILAGGEPVEVAWPPGFVGLARRHQGTLYLVAARDGTGQGPLTLELPFAEPVRVRFENRQLASLKDVFSHPHEVHVYELKDAAN